MKYSLKNSSIKQIDGVLKITQLFSGDDFNFSCVKAELHGSHGKFVSTFSDRAYYFLGGKGIVSVGNENYTVGVGDFVTIKAGMSHGLEGDLEYLIINSPSYNPDHEKKLH